MSFSVQRSKRSGTRTGDGQIWVDSLSLCTLILGIGYRYRWVGGSFSDCYYIQSRSMHRNTHAKVRRIFTRHITRQNSLHSTYSYSSLAVTLCAVCACVRARARVCACARVCVRVCVHLYVCLHGSMVHDALSPRLKRTAPCVLEVFTRALPGALLAAAPQRCLQRSACVPLPAPCGRSSP